MLLAACWTGTVPEPALAGGSETRASARRSISRSSCAAPRASGCARCSTSRSSTTAQCATSADTNVAVTGERTRRVTRAQMHELSRSRRSRALLRARSTRATMPSNSGCTTIGRHHDVLVPFVHACARTRRTRVLTVSRPRRGGEHTIDDAHCSDDGAAVHARAAGRRSRRRRGSDARPMRWLALRVACSLVACRDAAARADDRRGRAPAIDRRRSHHRSSSRSRTRRARTTNRPATCRRHRGARSVVRRARRHGDAARASRCAMGGSISLAGEFADLLARGGETDDAAIEFALHAHGIVEPLHRCSSRSATTAEAALAELVPQLDDALYHGNVHVGVGGGDGLPFVRRRDPHRARHAAADDSARAAGARRHSRSPRPSTTRCTRRASRSRTTTIARRTRIHRSSTLDRSGHVPDDDHVRRSHRQ